MDDIDDLYGAFGVLYESVRGWFLSLLAFAAVLLTVASGIMLALVHPPLALATGIVLFVTLLYRSATSPARTSSHSI